MNRLAIAAATGVAGLIAVAGAALPAQAIESSDEGRSSKPAAPAPATPGGTSALAAAPASGRTYYLLNNNDYHGAWADDGVKGQIKNFTKKTIVVTDKTMGASRTLAPNDTVIFYADTDLRGYAGRGEGDGTRFEIAELTPQVRSSQFWLSDSWVGRPDAVYDGPQGVQNVRAGMQEGESHAETAGPHRFWIKRESDSWKSKYDNWNTADWAAFSIHVDEI